MYPHAVLRRRRRVDRVTFANLVSEPENFAAWSASGTPVLTGGQSDPFGGTDAFLLEDDDGMQLERIDQAVDFTGDGKKGFSLFIKQGPNPPSANMPINIRDTTAGAHHQVVISWSNGVPSLASETNASFLEFLIYPDGWYRVLAQTDAITASNSFELRIAPSASSPDTGDVLIFGATAHDEPTPGAYERA